MTLSQRLFQSTCFSGNLCNIVENCLLCLQEVGIWFMSILIIQMASFWNMLFPKRRFVWISLIPSPLETYSSKIWAYESPHPLKFPMIVYGLEWVLIFSVTSHDHSSFGCCIGMDSLGSLRICKIRLLFLSQFC